MTQQQREAIAGMLRASLFDPAGDLREQRPLFDQMIAAASVPADVVTTPGQLGGVPVIHVDIPGTTTDGVILYFHGGFFAIGSAASSVGLAADPAVSPIYARLAGLPPLLIQAGSHEILLDDAIRLAARAAHDDVAVTLDVAPGVPHVFQAFAAILDEGQAALTRAGAFLRQHTGTAAAGTAARRE